MKEKNVARTFDNIIRIVSRGRARARASIEYFALVVSPCPGRHASVTEIDAAFPTIKMNYYVACDDCNIENARSSYTSPTAVTRA